MGCLLGVGGTPGFRVRHEHEAVFSLRRRRRSLGLQREVEEAPVCGWQLLITRPCCLCFNPLFHGPREVDKEGWLFVIDDSQNMLDTAAAVETEVWIAERRKRHVSFSFSFPFQTKPQYGTARPRSVRNLIEMALSILLCAQTGYSEILSSNGNCKWHGSYTRTSKCPVLVSCSACCTCTYLPWRCCYPRLRDRYGRFGRACAGLCGVPPASKVFLLPSLVPSRYQPGACHPLLPPDSRLRPSAAASRSIDRKFSLRCDLMQLLTLGS